MFVFTGTHSERRAEKRHRKPPQATIDKIKYIMHDNEKEPLFDEWLTYRNNYAL